MADQKPWLGPDTFPTIWIWICVVFNFIGILSHFMLIISETVIIFNNFNNYVNQYGHSYPASGYVGPDGVGIVAYTNAPTHYGSAVWMILFQVSIIVFASLAVASDLAWRKATYNEWGTRYVTAFYAIGIMEGEHNKGLFYYVVANGFLKSFIVVLYMSQSFAGLSGGSHQFSYTGSVAVRNPHMVAGGNSVVVTASASAATYWRKRCGACEIPKIPQMSKPPRETYGTELWVEMSGWILLGSIVPSVVAFMFLVPWAAKKNDQANSADAEKGESDEEKKKKAEEQKAADDKKAADEKKAKDDAKAAAEKKAKDDAKKAAKAAGGSSG